MTKNSSQTQTGFSIVEMLIALIMVAALGLAAWMVVNKSHKKTPPSSSTTKPNQTSSPPPKPQDPSENGKYLVIKEWGVRVTLPTSLRGDISYFINDDPQKYSGGPVLVDFTSKNGLFKCGARSIISLEREIDGEGGETVDPPPFKRIGNKRFYFIGTTCEETINKEGSIQDKKLLSDLKEAVQTTLETN